MGVRSVKTIQKELNEVDSILLKLNESLVKFPDDIGLKLELSSFQSRQKYLIDELSHAQSKENISSTIMKIKGKDVGYGEMPVEKMGQIFMGIQPLVSALSVETEINKNAQIPEDILNSTELTVSAISAGSVNVLLKNKYPNYFNEDSDNVPIEKAFKNLGDLINCGDDYNKLQKKVENMNDKAVIYYRNFLNTLNKTETSIEFVNNIKKNKFEVSNKKAESIFKVITKATEVSKNYSVDGILLAIDIPSKNIKIKCSNTKMEIKPISINFEDKIENDVIDIKVKSKVHVEFTFTKKISEIEGNIKRKRELISIKKI
ncbi:MAG: hypothetical protein LBM96_12165 [Methanobrevibacter sp.]|nr:hypothetical protein [Candidatus Methanoflexus mossambicus]